MGGFVLTGGRPRCPNSAVFVANVPQDLRISFFAYYWPGSVFHEILFNKDRSRLEPMPFLELVSPAVTKTWLFLSYVILRCKLSPEINRLFLYLLPSGRCSWRCIPLRQFNFQFWPTGRSLPLSLCEWKLRRSPVKRLFLLWEENCAHGSRQKWDSILRFGPQGHLINRHLFVFLEKGPYTILDGKTDRLSCGSWLDRHFQLEIPRHMFDIDCMRFKRVGMQSCFFWVMECTNCPKAETYVKRKSR